MKNIVFTECMIHTLVPLIVISLVSSTLLWADSGDKSRTEHPIGIYITGNGDPAPGILGANLVANLTSFAKINIGASGYNDAMGENILTGMNNYSLRPLAYFFAYTFTWLFTGGNSKISYESFLSSSYKSPTSSAVTYGGGLKFVVPGWKLSPAAGINFSQWSGQGNPWGQDTGNHIYYNAGVDWQSIHTYAAFGYNICPALPLGACGVYLNVGGFF